jgi:hypothetical protein
MDRATRMFLTLLSCGPALALTVFWLQDSLRIAASSDAALVARFQGAAPEDIFGFGFWPTWTLFALVESGLLTGAWFLLRKHWFRHIVSLLVVAFVVASVFGYHSYHRELELWQR